MRPRRWHAADDAEHAELDVGDAQRFLHVVDDRGCDGGLHEEQHDEYREAYVSHPRRALLGDFLGGDGCGVLLEYVQVDFDEVGRHGSGGARVDREEGACAEARDDECESVVYEVVDARAR